MTTTSTEFNYDAFDAKITIDEALGKNAKIGIVAFIILTGLTVLLIAVASDSVDWRPDTSSMPIYVTAPLGAIVYSLFLWVVIQSWVQNAKRRLRFQRFAADNRIEVRHDGNPDDYSGVIFDAGDSHTRRIRQTLILPCDDGSFELGTYSYATGYGRHRTNYEYGFVRIQLARTLPNMVLDATTNNTFKVISNLPSFYTGGQKLSLEGNFDKFFTLYTPEQYKTDALYIFTPDVMQFFIDHLTDYDAEIIDNSLYLYKVNGFDVHKKETFQSLVEAAAGLHEKLDTQTKRYVDDRVQLAMQSVVIREDGRRLKSRSAVWIGAIALLAYMLVSYAFQALSWLAARSQ